MHTKLVADIFILNAYSVLGMDQMPVQNSPYSRSKVKLIRYSVFVEITILLREITCHMESHSDIMGTGTCIAGGQRRPSMVLATSHPVYRGCGNQYD